MRPAAPDHDDDADPWDAESPVRPYALVGGRTRVPDELGLSVGALVRGLVAPGPGLSPEERRILDLTRHDHRSVADLSARLCLPLGVIRVVVADLAGRGSVRVGARSLGVAVPPVPRSVLESVLDGIDTL
ncbi:MAG: DUF742 domain-containing protein [Kineosporiaceae bacterium]